MRTCMKMKFCMVMVIHVDVDGLTGTKVINREEIVKVVDVG